MWWLAVAVGVMLLSARVVAPQPAPPTEPPLSEIEATWAAFWTHMSLGDLEGAAWYLHSSLRKRLAPSADLRRMQEAADQMASCRIEPAASAIRIRADEVLYAVRCRHGAETADSYLGMRRDLDGVWRISAL